MVSRHKQFKINTGDCWNILCASWSGSRQHTTLWSLLTCPWNCSEAPWYIRQIISDFYSLCAMQPLSGFCTSLLLSSDQSSFLWVTLWNVKQVSSFHWLDEVLIVLLFSLDPIELIMSQLDAASLHRSVWTGLLSL